MTDLFSGTKVQIGLAVALTASLGWGYYNHTQVNNLEEQIVSYKTQLNDARAIDEINKQTARSNEIMLKTAIDRQNEMFDKLAKQGEEQSERVLAQLAKSQTSTAQQYARVSSAIEKIQIQSCEGMMDELINFPHLLTNPGSTK